MSFKLFEISPLYVFGFTVKHFKSSSAVHDNRVQYLVEKL